MSANDTKNSNKPKRQVPASIHEALGDIGKDVANSFKKDLAQPLAKDFFKQFIGFPQSTRKFEGEITPGETLNMKDVMTGKREGIEKERKQLTHIRVLEKEEHELVKQKGNEIKVQLQALMQEIQALAKVTPQLAQEINIAAIQAPANPGIYHVIFFEKILEFLKSFRKKISNASEWLHSANARAAKKNAWGSRYKEHGAKYLLSGEHYLTRSAG